MTDLELSGVITGYDEVEVLHGIDIRVESGRLTAIVGPNGAGKSTLLRSIAGLVRVWSGEIFLGGEQISGRKPHHIVNQGVALVPERRHLFPEMTVEENLMLGAYSSRARARHSEKLHEVYDMFPRLRERTNQRASSLSGGEQQMCALARALMANPAVLMLDEPSLGLAPKIIDTVMDHVASLRDSGITVLLLEQRVEAALSLSDFAYVLRNGQVVLAGDGPSLIGSQDLQDAYFGVSDTG